MVLYTHDHVQSIKEMSEVIIMCTYPQSHASKEVFKTHHMYLLMVTCDKINELR